MRVFRVLVLDDVGYDGLNRRYEQFEGEPSTFLAATSPGDGSLIESLFVRLSQLAKKHEKKFDAYVARDVFFDDEQPVFSITAGSPSWDNDFLPEVDVVVLDLKYDNRQSPRKWTLPKSLTEAQETSIRDGLHGVGFYLNEALSDRGKLRNCQCVVILSQFDGVSAPLIVQELIDPCCHDDSIPFTVKFKAGRGADGRSGFTATGDIIESLASDFFEGYTQLDHRGAIEFAASHNEPVLIVGETGTGKEYVARAIHRRWVQEQRRRQNDRVNPNLTIFNCAALSKELARTELFGAVYGSYTGSQGHQVGLILEACGFKPLPFGQTGGFLEALRTASNGLLPKPGEFTLTGGPFGTLFLDELADLPIEVQTYLLRYLESYEVLAVNSGTPVKKAWVRVIAATSDPRVAAFVGKEVFAPRSKTELERPLRDDFLFRLKGQIIRTQPVTKANALGAVQHTVKHAHAPQDEREAGPNPPWSEEAITHLAGRIGDLAESIRKAVAAGHEATARFGHRREVVRIVRLANAYVREANRRGLRNVTPEVTPEVIDRVWEPSHVASDEVGPPTTHESFTGRPGSPEEVRALFEQICRDGGAELHSGWSSKEFREHVKSSKFLRGTLTGDRLLEELSKVAADEVYERLFRLAFEGLGHTAIATVRTWFSTKRP